MRYSLEKDGNGRITQCDNADGNGNVYAQRKELNKLALENLQRPTPGKLSDLSNLQLFNFRIADIDTGPSTSISKMYNTTSTFPANAVQTVMFGVDGINNKALYYNIVYINAKLNNNFISGSDNLLPPSYISFYLLQNNDSSTSSLGTKIPQPAPLYGNGGSAVTFTTSGNVFGAQSLTCDIRQEQGLYAQNNDLKGFRASGLALQQINLNFETSIDREFVAVDVEVGVDLSSVSTTY